MLPIRALTAAFVLLVLAAVPLQAQEGTTFQYHMDESDRLIYETSSEVIQTQEFNGQEFKNEIKQRDVSIRTLVEKTEQGNFRVQSENKLLQVEMNIGPLGTFTYDSTSSERDKSSQLGSALTPLYESLTGAYTTIFHSPLGEVVKVKGFEDLEQGLLKQNPMAKQFAPGSTNQGAKATISDTFIQFPEKPLKPGDKWEVPFEMELPGVGKLKGKDTYTYVGRETVDGRELAKFDQASEVTIDLETGSEQAQVTGTMSASDATGTILFDPERGHVVSKTNEFKLSGDLTVEAGGMFIDVGQSQQQTIKFRLLDKVPEK